MHFLGKPVLRALMRFIWLWILVAGLEGCSSIRPASSGREGFFDRLSHGGNPSRVRPSGPGSDSQAAAEPALQRRARLVGLRWPLKQVQVTSPFGQRGSEFHEGIDLRARVGTLVFASQAGQVIYAGSKIRGYGRMIVIRHAGGLATVYAHNSRLLVRSGQRVQAGQRIAISGKTGHANGPHLHFEIRSGLAAIDPLSIMPKLQARSRPRAASQSVAVASANGPGG